MKRYCVKQRKQMKCVPGSEQYVKTKNAMKCKCAECGITKFCFVKGTTTRAKTAKKGKGLLLGRNSPFNEITLIGAIL